MKAKFTLITGVTLSLCFFIGSSDSAENAANPPRQVDWRNDIRAVVTPGYRTIFVVTNFEEIALRKVSEHAPKAETPPELIRFDSPQKLYEAVEHIRKLRGFISFGQGWKCPDYNNNSGFTGNCTQDGTNYVKAFYDSYPSCIFTGSTNDWCDESPGS